MLKEGTKVRFHGGWDGTKERCPVCHFQCSFTYLGVIIESYPGEEQWTVLLETGSYVVGTPEQFEVTD